VVVHRYVDGDDTVINQISASQFGPPLADVSAGGGHTEYGVRFKGQSGQSSDNVTNGVSINKLLTDSNIDPKTVSFMAVPRPDGTWSTLTTPQLQNPLADGVFEDSLLPVVHSLGDGIEYIRPLTSPSDVNNVDVFTPTDETTPLNVYVFTGPMLTVKATASKHKVKPGTAVNFSATATDNGTSRPAGSTNYAWDFGGDGTASTAAASHTFAKPGEYQVFVTATGVTDDAGGIAKPILITVGTPTPRKSGSPGPTPTKTPNPTPNPTRTPAPAPSATGHPPANGHSPGHPGSGHGQFGDLGGSLAARLNRQIPQLLPPGIGGLPTVAPPASLPVVSGQVVAGDGVPLSASELASDSTIVQTAPSIADATRWSPGVLPIYIGVVLFLLGAGVARERGWLTLRRR
jgi:hypothetical protein